MTGLAETANCGDVNVSLVHLEQTFLECGLVADAAAAALPHPMRGKTLGVLLVPAGDGYLSPAEVHAFACARLSAAQRPTRLLWAKNVPRMQDGKVDRGRVRDALLSEAAVSMPDIGTEERLISLVRARGFAHATSDDDLLALGFTSLDLLQLAAEIEQEFSITVDLAVMLTAPTIGELNKHVHQSMPES